MSRSKLKEFAQRKREQINKEDYWPSLCERISKGLVIPIISNSVRYNQLFNLDDDQTFGISEDGIARVTSLSIDERLAQMCARWIRYPLRRHKQRSAW